MENEGERPVGNDGDSKGEKMVGETDKQTLVRRVVERRRRRVVSRHGQGILTGINTRNTHSHGNKYTY